MSEDLQQLSLRRYVEAAAQEDALQDAIAHMEGLLTEARSRRRFAQIQAAKFNTPSQLALVSKPLGEREVR